MTSTTTAATASTDPWWVRIRTADGFAHAGPYTERGAKAATTRRRKAGQDCADPAQVSADRIDPSTGHLRRDPFTGYPLAAT